LISAPSIWLTSLEEHGRSFTPAHILGGWAFRLAGDTADTPMPVIAALPRSSRRKAARKKAITHGEKLEA
jgi:hypothetical protein